MPRICPNDRHGVAVQGVPIANSADRQNAGLLRAENVDACVFQPNLKPSSFTVLIAVAIRQKSRIPSPVLAAVVAALDPDVGARCACERIAENRVSIALRARKRCSRACGSNTKSHTVLNRAETGGLAYRVGGSEPFAPVEDMGEAELPSERSQRRLSPRLRCSRRPNCTRNECSSWRRRWRWRPTDPEVLLPNRDQHCALARDQMYATIALT